ncbi:MAG: glycerol dehydrogenase [Anaerovoracaceae bacterium]|jgi:glycerol dehydrogenase
MKIMSLAGPEAYYQGKGLLKDMASCISNLGKRFLIITDDIVWVIINKDITRAFARSDLTFEVERFTGESTENEAKRLAKRAETLRCDALIGAGGGKVIDSTKFAADLIGKPVVIVPTAATSDAPCSTMSVVYDEDGTFLVSRRMKHHPAAVLVDTDIISKAPVRLLRAGIGDAYATWYEARAARWAGASNYNNGVATEAAFALARLCNDILIESAEEAVHQVEQKEWSEAVDRTVEAAIYLSGIGFENNGCAIAHAFYSGLTELVKPFPAMHGEAVAVGTLVQLELEYLEREERDEDEWNEVIEFYERTGLPKCLTDIGIDPMDGGELMQLSKMVCRLPNAGRMPFPVQPKMLADAIRTVNR